LSKFTLKYFYYISHAFPYIELPYRIGEQKMMTLTFLG